MTPVASNNPYLYKLTMKTKSTIAPMKTLITRTIATLIAVLILSVTFCRIMDITLPSEITTLYNYAPIAMIALVMGIILYKMIRAVALTVKSRFSNLPE
jgi:hypothetical protein